MSLGGGHGVRRCTLLQLLTLQVQAPAESAPPDPAGLSFGLVPRPGSILGPETLSPLTTEAAEATCLARRAALYGPSGTSESAGSSNLFSFHSVITQYFA